MKLKKNISILVTFTLSQYEDMLYAVLLVCAFVTEWEK